MDWFDTLIFPFRSEAEQNRRMAYNLTRGFSFNSNRHVFQALTAFGHKVEYRLDGNANIHDREVARSNSIFDDWDFHDDFVAALNTELVLPTLQREGFVFMVQPHLPYLPHSHIAHLWQVTGQNGTPTIEIDLNCVDAAHTIVRASEEHHVLGCSLDILLITCDLWTERVIRENLAMLPKDVTDAVRSSDVYTKALEQQQLVIIHDTRAIEDKFRARPYKAKGSEKGELTLHVRELPGGVHIRWEAEAPQWCRVLGYRTTGGFAEEKGEQIVDSAQHDDERFDRNIEPGKTYYYTFTLEGDKARGMRGDPGHCEYTRVRFDARGKTAVLEQNATITIDSLIYCAAGIKAKSTSFPSKFSMSRFPNDRVLFPSNRFAEYPNFSRNEMHFWHVFAPTSHQI